MTNEDWACSMNFIVCDAEWSFGCRRVRFVEAENITLEYNIHKKLEFDWLTLSEK